MRWLSYLPVWPKFKKEEYFVNNPVDVEHNQKSTVDDENKSQDACSFHTKECSIPNNDSDQR
ncbi:hypothetical protein E2C01_025051 [Portunus trituberculatus]|uniref:Uncharacterized protein n=1 Tax=Portunus trituberculatus TaxID=210409 RepID=A0A5B7EGT4_PORTR|nr:hypothetical protein [Portunus trituberculatus]